MLYLRKIFTLRNGFFKIYSIYFSFNSNKKYKFTFKNSSPSINDSKHNQAVKSASQNITIVTFQTIFGCSFQRSSLN